MRNFRNLEVWKEAIDLASLVYTLTKKFPKQEQYGLVSQINRCSVSIPSNIAEGCSRSSEKEYSRFLEIAIGSSFEMETQLEISKNLNYLDSETFKSLVERLNVLQRRINALRTSIK
ncbi:MAG: four helix bundle protein [Saprospiraceae bacterium]|jgi:four helix bundle protein|uniref:four helix bundle protein n=1 Tax=Candidatus Brachybacter algidus TaxID=2982024 RepID=UPI001B6445F5|nr:four helix bundle protein [Candidatus Brachybacter algidus]MBP7306668.1 four helix bundle protein [Saprospiraceae bacterium]MBP9758314.1 four helix bundle protein [Candidatus Dojkabacteria bacterium]MBK6374319.1 four helix bundle protein [Candidatus Brachybacter algidus]MBK6450642.1 four helix bundle protein [Candidatus Brachybacter algidus]MBK7604747.1 four helix bundle protein [Candidatus Brachybacter algidus]